MSDQIHMSIDNSLLHLPLPNEDIPQLSNFSTGKKFVCETCGHAFTRKHNLVSHELIHTKEKPHSCTICGSKFRRLHDLKRHEKLHTGEKPYSCDKCGRKFARCDALVRHNNSQSGCILTDHVGTGSNLSSGIDANNDSKLMVPKNKEKKNYETNQWKINTQLPSITNLTSDSVGLNQQPFRSSYISNSQSHQLPTRQEQNQAQQQAQQVQQHQQKQQQQLQQSLHQQAQPSQLPSQEIHSIISKEIEFLNYVKVLEGRMMDLEKRIVYLENNQK